jgi:excisionase family DNA binding protein
MDDFSCFFYLKQGGLFMTRQNIRMAFLKEVNDTDRSGQAEELLTVREVAHRLRVDDTTVRRWIKSGALEAIALPHSSKRQRYCVKKVTLDALLKSSPLAI